MATQQEIGEHIDLRPRRIRELVKLGVLPPSKGRGGLNLDQCRLAYIAYLRGIASGHRSEDGELDLTAERAKLAREQTATAAIKNATSRGELIPADMVLEHWAGQIVAVKSHLRAIPSQFKSEVPHLEPEELETLRRLIDQTLTHLADGIPPTTADTGGKKGEQHEPE